MRKVKLLELYNFYDCDGYHDGYRIGKDTQWDTVSDEDFELLKQWCNKNSYKGGSAAAKFVIVTESDVPLEFAVKEVLRDAAEAKRLEEKRKAEEVAKREKYKVKREKKQKDDELKQLQELLQKHPEVVAKTKGNK